MIVERDIDCGALYEGLRVQLLALVGGLSEPQLATTVPATPAWSVQDVIAHLVGICADLNGGRFGATSGDEWTAAQVGSRRGRSLGDVATEWDAEAPRFEDGLRLFGYEMGSHFVGDLVQHLADIHNALGRPPFSDDEAIMVALDFYLDSFHATLLDQGIGAVEVKTDRESLTLGAGAMIAAMGAPSYGLLRALGGRRSEAQVRALEWSGDVERVLPLVSRYGLPAIDLVEPGIS